MLEKIEICNFKCFEELKLRCAPITLLCGLNGMGKSSVIQAILLLRQSFQAGRLQKGQLVLGGALLDLGTSTDVFFEDADNETLGFGIHIHGEAEPWFRSFDYIRDVEQLEATPAQATISERLSQVPPFGGQVIYVEADRVGPRTLYPQSKILAQMGDFGKRGQMAWNLLHDRQFDLMDSRDARCEGLARRRMIDAVDHWLQDVSPGAHLELRAIREADSITAGFRFDRDGDVVTSRYRATNVGFGLSYVLPVLLAMLSEGGTLVLIENPEAHLHPRGQTRLAELAVRAACSGVQLFVETHSDHFLDGVRIAVRNGLLAPEDIAIHYFERSGTRAVVSSPVLDCDGRLSHWPVGFFDQHQDNLVKLLVPRK
ncbi:MAG: DUF3696 domain-containing protein [Bryobacterales bacterium]|nr:DUF3696 domain-containing protein [Bryobacterales bacterium]